MWSTQPEVLRGDKYGSEADVWSLGVIFYVLLCGYLPFYDEDLTSLFTSIKGGMYEFHDEAWADVSPEATDMIKKMLCVNQKKRWTAVQLLSHPWIRDENRKLRQKSLRHSIITIKKCMIRKRFKAAVHLVILTNRLARQYSVKNTVSNLLTINNSDSSPASTAAIPVAAASPKSTLTTTATSTTPLTSTTASTNTPTTYTIDPQLIALAKVQVSTIGASAVGTSIGQCNRRLAFRKINISKELNVIHEENNYINSTHTSTKTNSSLI